MISKHNNTADKMFVLLTGATGGLGRAFAVECASRGWDLFITDRQIGPLETLRLGLDSAYRAKVITYACDLTDATARESLFRHVRSVGHQFTMLINVAGVDFEGSFLDQDIHRIETIIRLNIEASVAMMHSTLCSRKPGSTFRIINVASLAAFYPMPIKATYAASKRFLLDLSLALREELGPQNISVTAVCPAGMPTTEKTIQAINAQGLAGFITTIDAGRVANQTLNAALAGRAVVIPGWINRVIQTISILIPPAIRAWLIYNRWSSVSRKSKSIRTVLEKSLLPNL